MSEPPKLSDNSIVEQQESEENLHIVWIRMRPYGNAHSRLRILSWFLFGWRLRRNARKVSQSPDVIIASSPPLIGIASAQAVARRVGALSILDIRDIWPSTLEKIGSISFNNPLVILMRWLEKKAYKRADCIISNLEDSWKHFEKFGVDKNRFIWLPNGISMSDMDGRTLRKPESVNSDHSVSFTVGYAGTIGLSNALEYLIDAATLLEGNSNAQFVLYGDGKERGRLEKKAKERNLANVRFGGRIAKRDVMKKLEACDALYLGWADSNLYDFGIGANKIPEYLLSGRPILHSYSGRCDPIARCAAGITVPAADPAAIADGIRRLEGMTPEERLDMGAKGRRHALEKLDYRVLGCKLLNVIEGCRASRRGSATGVNP